MDANWNDVELLLHFDGSDGSTTFTDLSNNGFALTPFGNAALTTAQQKFGSASLALDGTGDYVETAVDAAFGFGTGAWTFEAFIRPTALTADRGLFEFRSTRPSDGFFYISSTQRLAYSDATTVRGNTGTQVVLDTWQHVALTFDGTSMRGFLDGVLQWTATFTPDFGASRRLRLGASLPADLTAGAFFQGQIDAVRVTSGVARYTANFTPAAAAFPDGYRARLSDSSVLRPPSIFGALTVNGLLSDSFLLGQPRFLSLLTLGRVAAPGPMGAARLLGKGIFQARLSAASPLGANGARAWALHDFTAHLVDSPERCTADLITPDGPVRVPISSWQATVQTGFKDYGQCVVPACQPYLAVIDDATEIVIYRRGLLADGRYLDACVVRVPLQTAQFAQGPRRFTATLSGYAEAYTLTGIPPFSGRTLPGVQAVFTSAAGRRARGKLDWLIRPGHVVQVQGSPLTVAYINFTAGPNALFMDLGERSEA